MIMRLEEDLGNLVDAFENEYLLNSINLLLRMGKEKLYSNDYDSKYSLGRGCYPKDGDILPRKYKLFIMLESHPMYQKVQCDEVWDCKISVESIIYYSGCVDYVTWDIHPVTKVGYSYENI